MATNNSTILVRDMLNDHSQTVKEAGIQSFTMREANLNVLKVFDDSTPNFFNEATKRSLENFRNTNQTIDIDLWQKKALGAGSARVRSGTGQQAPATVQPTFLTGIQEGFDTSAINNSLSRFISENAPSSEAIKAKYNEELTRGFMKAYKNIYTRLNTAYSSYLDTNKWALNTLADSGSIYNTYLGDAKRVPSTHTALVLQNMQIESVENVFDQVGGGNPYLVTSPASQAIRNIYSQGGANNSVNTAQFMEWFDWYSDNNIVNGAGVQATMYEIIKGSIGMFQRVATAWNEHPNAINGDVTAGVDTWHKPIHIGRGTSIMPEMPPLKLELKSTSQYSDTSGTYTNNPESVIDLVDNYSLFIEPGAMVAYDPIAAKSPIIKYEVLS